MRVRRGDDKLMDQNLAEPDFQRRNQIPKYVASPIIRPVVEDVVQVVHTGA